MSVTANHFELRCRLEQLLLFLYILLPLLLSKVDLVLILNGLI